MILIDIFLPFQLIFMPGGPKMPYTLKKNLQLSAVQSCMSELPRTECKGSFMPQSQETERSFPFLLTMVLPINAAAWSVMCEAR